MLVERMRWMLGIGLACAVVLVAGCNVFDVSGRDPTSVDGLLAGARSALTEGNGARAVRLLERAFEKDSTDIRVRVELANALYAEQGVDVFTLRDVAAQLNGTADRSTSASTPANVNQRCTDGARPDASPERYERIALEEGAVREWVQTRALVNRVRRLVVRGGVNRPSSFSRLDVGTKRKGLLLAAVSVAADGVIDMSDAFEGTGSTLYLDNGTQSGRVLVACAEDEARLESAHGALCSMSDAAGQAVEWLRRRGRLSGRQDDFVLVPRVNSIVDVVESRLDCAALAS